MYGGMRWAVNELTPIFDDVYSSLRDPGEPENAIGEIMVGSARHTIDIGGRPDSFKPLSLATLVGRAGGSRAFKKRKRGGELKLRKASARRMAGAKILMDNLRLLGSITYTVGNWVVQWGTNLVYAAIHNFGGMAGRGRKIKISKRQFIHEPFPEDVEEIEQILADWAFGGLL